MKNRYKELLSDTLVIGLGNFTTKLIYFFLMPIYTMAMTASEFGEADLLNNLAALLLPVFTLSIAEGVFRFVLDKKENPNELLTAGIGVIGSCSLVSLAIIAVVFLVTKEQNWVYFYFYFITEAFRALFAQFARGVGNVRNFSISGIIAAGVLFGATYILVKTMSLGVVGYLLAFIIANLCSICYLIVTVKTIRKFVWLYSASKVKKILIYSLPLIPNTLSWWATNVSSRYILAYNCGIALAGLFAATSKLPALINIVTSVFQQSWQISSVKQSEADDYITFYSRVFTLYSSMVFITGATIIVLVPFISKFVLQGEFYEAWVYTPLLLFSAILGCFSVYFGNFYTVKKNSKAIMRTTIYGAISNVVLCFALIPFFGIYGALAANVLSFVIITGARFIDTQKFMPIKFSKWKIYTSICLLFVESLGMTSNNKYGYFFSVICIVIILAISLIAAKDVKKTN